MKVLIFYSLLLLTLLSCRTQNILSNQQQTGKDKTDSTLCYDPNYQYTVRKDDKISISVWGQDELSVGSVYGIYNSNEVYGKWLLVDANGEIALPKHGSIKVLGKTIPQLKDTIRLLSSKWIVNPVVDVKILNKEITLLGELRTPGVIQVDKDQNNLLEMVARAGGFDFYANLKRVKIFRQEGDHVRVTTLNLSKPKDYLAANITLQPGDVVVVPSKNYKEFDKRISVIIPFATAISAAAILLNLF